MYAAIAGSAFELLKRQSEEEDPDAPDSSQKEIFSSWALFILIMLLIVALFTSYLLQIKKVEAVHETSISIFAGMTIGLILRVSAGNSIQSLVSFDDQIFFNLLLPPIILASGYELHQANFFRNIGTILTFAFAGTFISAIVLGLVLWLYTRIPLDGVSMTFVDAISVGATLSATDPVTILAIFNTYKVDPKLYTVIFGESILNDAIAIVLFETAQKYKEGGNAGTLGLLSLFEGIGIFLAVFFGSLIIGIIIGIATALGLKYTYVRRFPKIESCLIVLIAYASYFFSNGLHMSVTVIGICVARYAAVFPLSRLINWFLRYRAKKRGQEVADELPYNYQVMLFWAGLRGAVGVALAAGMTGENSWALKATVLVVVVLTVIIFGGTTARMLEILGIRTGVVEEIDSDDEFDIEAISGGNYYKHSGSGIGNDPRRSNGSMQLDGLARPGNRRGAERGSYASGNASPDVRSASMSRKGSNGRKENESEQDLLGRTGSTSDEEFDSDSSDLPPPANRPPKRRPSPPQDSSDMGTPYPTSGSTNRPEAPHITASGAISQLLHGTAEDHAAWFKQLDEGFIKPKLLLDGGKGPYGGPSGS
ncbi:hypothetical protein SS1G_12448 [Sclerotinia sclerotiorum 1980 UF-70]|uniref:Sodium/hydrogen exchanger n=1 Tax=Sclerotinia sclerotiorum (strain ATCC 18683 / 1980 / Ss-1) TaxID=665079 RepID=A7F4C4_SCLS1|nr:hypothetical protein SS1G_12448 [Sclerotinia sclerotiorum 1980 UF-70]EDN97595.1 hypothetical protein SS1G_12448 [Sclerotinia sclerotiorum 1980 UF-70]